VIDMAAELAPVEALLRDGRRINIRTVEPDDADAFRAAFARLSPEARYNRMMGAVRELSDAVVQKAVNPNVQRELALVAVSAEPDSAIVGGGRYIVEAGGDSCEFAVAVADDWQRTGLASQLMKSLIANAQHQGLKAMHGYVFAGNKAMLGLARRFGFDATRTVEGPTVLLVCRDLSRRE
jgi:GNAT superfamily N-acetyltransferase